MDVALVKVCFVPSLALPSVKLLDRVYSFEVSKDSHLNVDYSSAISVLIVILGVVTAKIVNAVFKEKDY